MVRRFRAPRARKYRFARRSRPAYRKKYPRKYLGGIRNIYKYKRYCADSTIQNVEIGNVKWVDNPASWDLGVPDADDNGLYRFGGVMRFQLDDVINASDFTSLYDRYKITGVKVTFVPLANQGYNAITTNGNEQSGVIPTLITSVDYDDSGLPANSIELLEKQDARTYRLDKPVTIFIKYPKLSSTVNADSGPVSASIGTRGWINCANDDVNFRGLKFYLRDMMLPDASKQQNSLIRMQVKYYLAFKDPQ